MNTYNIYSQIKKTKNMITTKSIFSVDEAVKIIENAFHQTEVKGAFENNCVYAIKNDKQTVIRPKNSFCYDPTLIKQKVSDLFPSEKYLLSITCFMVIIEEVIK